MALKSFPQAPFRSLEDAAGWFRDWFAQGALPIWSTVGVDPENGGFQEMITVTGQSVDAVRRARVQARQTYVFASAERRGTPGPWLQVATAGYDLFARRYRLPGGLFAMSAHRCGALVDAKPRLYEQDFAILAMAALYAADPSRTDVRDAAEETRVALEAYRHPAGGFREVEGQAFQANAHMHLLEASLAWEEAGEAQWAALSNEIVDLALNHFIDPESAFLREFFDADWRPAPGADGRWVEPGHQYEWAWLLESWALRRGGADQVRALARRLFDNGEAGVDPTRGVAVNVVWEDMTVRDPVARLWPQTERLRAALAFDRPEAALAAAQALAMTYLDTPVRGVWQERMEADGGFIDEPAPASSLYHLANACHAFGAKIPTILG